MENWFRRLFIANLRDKEEGESSLWVTSRMASYVFFQNPAKENLTFLVDVHWHFHAVIVDFQWDCRPLFVSF